MSATDSRTAAPFGAITLYRAVTRVGEMLATVHAWRRARATEAALAELTDAQLADIGLHRGVIAEVAGMLARRD